MVVDKKSTRTKILARKDKKMLPVTDSLENSTDSLEKSDILENLSKELIHVKDCNKKDMSFITNNGVNKKELATMNNVNKKELTSMSFSRLPRGRKRRTVPRELDFTGHSPVMVVEHLNNQRVVRESTDYKEEQPFANLDKSVDIADFENECKTVVNYYSIDKQKLAQMTTEELRDYAKFIANKINLNQPNDCNF